jgi:hypothetical protein
MKLKLVLVGRRWRNDKALMQIAEYFYSDEFINELNKILHKNIPSLDDWGPSEAYYQLFDHGLPLGRHNKEKNGVVICFSQLWEKSDRDLQKASECSHHLVKRILQLLKISIEMHLFTETHVSNLEGQSFFVEIPAEWIR